MPTKKTGMPGLRTRPRVSDDNVYSEALFRIAKYRPEFPVKGFVNLEAARAWATDFVRWYKHQHRHSGMMGVTKPSWMARHDLYSKPARVTQNAGRDTREIGPQ